MEENDKRRHEEKEGQVRLGEYYTNVPEDTGRSPEKETNGKEQGSCSHERRGFKRGKWLIHQNMPRNPGAQALKRDRTFDYTPLKLWFEWKGV